MSKWLNFAPSGFFAWRVANPLMFRIAFFRVRVSVRLGKNKNTASVRRTQARKSCRQRVSDQANRNKHRRHQAAHQALPVIALQLQIFNIKIGDVRVARNAQKDKTLPSVIGQTLNRHVGHLINAAASDRTESNASTNRTATTTNLDD